MKVVTPIILVLLLTACSYQSYEGEPLPENEVAVVEVGKLKGIRIIAVDGKSVPDIAVIHASNMTLIPGCHTLTYALGHRSSWSNCLLCNILLPPYSSHYGCANAVINAEAGHRYETIFSSDEWGILDVTILDLTTQEEVMSVPAQERRSAFETCKVPSTDLCVASTEDQPETN